jgi:hypothetical protein
MRPILIAFIFLLLFVPCLAQEKKLKGFWAADLELMVSDVKKTKATLEIQITLKNKGTENVLTVSPIVNADIKTSYFLGFNSESKMLQIYRVLLSYPNDISHPPEPCYALYILEAGKSISEKFVLGYPLAVNSYFGAVIDITKYNKFNTQIGVLPFDEAIYKIRNKRPFGQCVEPQDKIEDGNYSGKTLAQIQYILSANAN